jgi:LPXTG-motif cell wall-anchored protein
VTSNPLTNPETPERIVAAIDRLIALIKRYTTRPALLVVRGTLFGLMSIAGVVMLMTFFVIGAVRGLHELLDVWLSRDAAVWSTYLGLGGLLLILGGLIMRRRRPRD